MGKIDKLNKDINKIKTRIHAIEEEMNEAKQDLADKIITKAEFTKFKQKHQMKVRDLHSAIGKKEKARVHFEKKIREKEEKKQKKREERDG